MTFTNFNKRKNSSTKGKLKNFSFVKLSRNVNSPYLLLILLLCVQCKSTEGVFVETPKNATVIVNQSTFFNCSRSSNQSREPIWYHHPVDGNRRDVYDFGKVKDRYIGRFDIDKNATSGIYNLLVKRPEPADAGRYECVENVDLDTGPSAELTVLGSNVVCESDKDPYELPGPTACNLNMTRDQLQLMCVVSYSGNIVPQLQWTVVGNAMESLETKCGERGSNSVMCNATLKSSLNMTESVYICHMITEPQYNCSWKVSKIIYALPYNSLKTITTSMEEVCSANTSMGLACSYKWLKDNTTVQLGDAIKPNKPGRYMCEAECTIRNEKCAFQAMAIDVSESEHELGAGPIAMIVIGIVIFMIIVIIIVYFLKRKRQKKSCETQSQQQPTSGISPDQVELLSAQPRNRDADQVDSGDSVQHVIQKAFNKRAHLRKGLSGEMYGSGVYGKKDCACEQIMCSSNQLTCTNKGEIIKDEKFRNRCQQWWDLDHGNLIKFYNVLIENPAVYIITEQAEGGSVREALEKCRECGVNLELPVVRDWAIQIAKGMNYLHGKNIIHENLNSVQILIMESFDGKDIFNKSLKISQFCLTHDHIFSTQILDTYKFAAPEVFAESFVKEGDVWSFGIVIWEMLTNRRPYESEHGPYIIQTDICKGAEKLELSDWIPEELKRILIECRSIDISGRPCFSEIYERLQGWNIVG